VLEITASYNGYWHQTASIKGAASLLSEDGSTKDKVQWFPGWDQHSEFLSVL